MNIEEVTRRRTTTVSARQRLMFNTTPPHVARGPSLRQVAPPPHMCDCLRRVKTVRFMNGWRFTFLISRKRPFRERRRVETSPMALPARPVITDEAQCSVQPLSLTRDRPRTLARIRPKGKGSSHEKHMTTILHGVGYSEGQRLTHLTDAPPARPWSIWRSIGMRRAASNDTSFAR